ncbi:hypothetical protein BASA81_003617 [Batrachochytrium salamandrivorans]|nr:hypothetical protein BASA81_003617 [Batrachochytrium salamandrivorans]
MSACPKPNALGVDCVEEEMEAEYNCMWCSDSFATYAALIEHANLHDFDVRRTCGDCGACFTRLQQFKNHQCAGSFACGRCGHRFASDRARQLHLQHKHGPQDAEARRPRRGEEDRVKGG